MAAVSDICLAEFIDRHSRPTHIHQLISYLGDSSLNSYRFGDVDLSGTIQTVDTVGDASRLTPTSQVLMVNLLRSANIRLSKQDRAQILSGNYSPSLFIQLFNYLLGSIEDTVWDAFLESAWAAAGDNVAAGSGENILNKSLSASTTSIIADFVGRLDAPGVGQMMFASSPSIDPRIRNLFQSQLSSSPVGSQMLGVPFMGACDINGIPMVKSHAVPKRWTVSATSSAISSNVLVCTVPSGHGLQVGMLVTTSGGAANVSTATAITAVTATTVEVPLTAANNATNGALTIDTGATVLVLFDVTKAAYAGDVVPDIEEVSVERAAGSRNLQASSLFGRKVIDGSVRLLLAPA